MSGLQKEFERYKHQQNWTSGVFALYCLTTLFILIVAYDNLDMVCILFLQLWFIFFIVLEFTIVSLIEKTKAVLNILQPSDFLRNR